MVEDDDEKEEDVILFSGIVKYLLKNNLAS